MKSYTIKQVSPIRYAFTVLPVVFGSLGVMIYLKKAGMLASNEPWAFPIIVVILGLAFYLTKYTASAETVIDMGEEGITFVWKKCFPGDRRRDETVSWSAIGKYLYQSERNHDLLKITLMDGRVLKIYHSIWQRNRDDFNEFQKDLSHEIDKRNLQNKLQGYTIEIGSTFYESNAARIIAIGSAIFLIVVTILVFSFGNPLGMGNIAALGAGYSAVLFFAIQVYIAHSNRKDGTDVG